MATGVKTGGRKKGTPNKATAALAAEIAESGETPLGYMLGLMRDPAQVQEVRLDAAKSAAPYVHPKLAAIEHTGADGKDLIPEAPPITEIARRLAFLLTAGAKETEQK